MLTNYDDGYRERWSLARLGSDVYEYKKKVAERPADSNGVEVEVYLSSGVNEHPNDISLVL
jgi:hypothetical protein